METRKAKAAERSQMVIDRYNAGKTQTSIAKDLGIHPSAVSRIVKHQWGIKPQSRQDESKELAAKGYTQTAIANILGVSQPYVHYMLAAN